MTDIVDRLRAVSRPRWKMTGEADAGVVEMADDPLAQEAADEIERLRAALRRIAVIDDSYSETYVDLRKVGSIAREALDD